jgi:hypothetical protein
MSIIQQIPNQQKQFAILLLFNSIQQFTYAITTKDKYYI